MEEHGPNSAAAAVNSRPCRNHPSHAVPQLTCERCCERKTKCDKLEPCTNCVSAGTVCVPVRRLRLPRGRHAQNRPDPVDEDVKRRIRRLEALISDAGLAESSKTGSQFLRRRGDATPQPSAGSDPEHIVSAPPNGTTSDPRASNAREKRALLVQRPDHFWADLAEEIYGLRDIIESAPSEAENDSTQTPEPAHLGSVHRDISILGLCGSTSLAPTPGHFDCARSPASHNSIIARRLCQVYLQQVDPIIKILHRQSLEKFMLQGKTYLAYPDGHSSVVALSSAVIYSAATSMTENQCQEMFQVNKANLVTDCRRACEVAIERSGLLATRDLTVLQAFVLYLVARRSEERSRAVWTLVAVAVRIAKALSIYLDPEKLGRRETFFVRQMRVRLWLTICLLDIQASFGQASQPLITVKEAMSSSQLPSHINDSDFEPATPHPVPDREGLTDTTFAIVKYKLQLMGRLTNFSAHEEKSCNDDAVGGDDSMTDAPPSVGGMSNVEVRQQHVRRFEQDVLQLLQLCDPESSPYAWFTFHSAQCFMIGARACVLRPFQRLREGSQPPPPRVRGETELLRLAAYVLEKALLMHTDPRGEGFRWYVTIQWHVLAIAIAECFICTDMNLVLRVWPIVEASYRLHETAIARIRSGKLRGPLGKLMERTRERVGPITRGGHSSGESLSFAITNNSGEVSPTPASESNPLAPSENLPDSLRAASISVASTEPTHTAAHMPSASILPQQSLSSTSASLGSNYWAAALLPLEDPASANGNSDESWRIWEEFVADVSFDDSTSLDPDSFFWDSNMPQG